VDGQSADCVQAVLGVEEFLDRLRTALRDRSFRPVPVRERMIPKAGGRQRRLGIATVTDRVVVERPAGRPESTSHLIGCSWAAGPTR
jgi:RNA-directed DNA polymerase